MSDEITPDANEDSTIASQNNVTNDASSTSNENESGGLMRFLYNQNPFYLISAGLVLHGIRTTLQSSQNAYDPWVLATVFFAYTALLAVTSFLIVKWGSVWDDARTIFMVLLLLFLAMPVSFDSLVNSAPSTTTLLLSGVFLFAVVVTESLTRGLGIRLPALFRIPYYAMLGVGILYPLIIAAQTQFAPEMDLRWTLAAFPFCCAAAILSLIPAARKNRKYVLKNGTPWYWPLFPYSVFTLLIVGLCGRVYLLTLAFDPSVGDGSIFGGYFLAPIYLATLLVVLEIAITERIKELQVFMLTLMPLSIPMCVNWSDLGAPAYFLTSVNELAGSPVWLATLAVVAIYLVAALRRVESAQGWLMTGLVIASMIHQDGSRVKWMMELEAWPLIALSIAILLRKEDRSMSWRWLVASALVGIPVIRNLSLLPTFTGLPIGAADVQFLLGVHWVLIAVVLVAMIFDDRFSQKLRVVLAMGLPMFVLIATLVVALRPSLEPMKTTYPLIAWLPVIYAACLGSLSLVCLFASNLRLYLYASLACGLIAIAFYCRGQTISLDSEYRWLIIYSLIGLCCFAAGVMISSAKAGFADGLHLRLRREWERVSEEFAILFDSAGGETTAIEPTVDPNSSST